MALTAKKLKGLSKDNTQLKLIYGDDDITKYWSSSLFNTVYLRHDLSDKHANWNDEDDLDFQNFLNELRNIATDYKDRERELTSWSETETINNWVKRILGALGWEKNCTGKLNPYLEETSFRYDNRTYRTDILIVDLPNEKMYVKDAEGDKRIRAARESVLMPVEVKYWQRLEEYRQGKKEEKRRADKSADDIARSATPNEQTIQYMNVLKKSWGILTDGARWRLFNSEVSTEDPERYYEFNFAALFQAVTTEQTESDSLEITHAAKYFYHFFSKAAFFPKEEAVRPFVDEVLQYSKKYVNKVEEDLRERFVKAMNVACNGLYKSAKLRGGHQDLSVIRNVSESSLFNILFIKSLESRGVLPMIATDYKKISLTSLIDKIERFDPDKEDLLNMRDLERAFKKGNGNSFSYKPEGYELHDRILRLTSVMHKGASLKDSFGFEISGFRESIFSNDEWQMFKSCKIRNEDWVKILFELGYAESESLNRKYQQIPYSYFTPRQLGSIYESFLEFQIEKAPADMIFEKKQWKTVNLSQAKYKNSDLPKVSRGDLFFTPNNKERKVTGSYYTPDNVVQYIVRSALSIAVDKKNSSELFELKICDPAMGSGHFLTAGLNFLSRAIYEKKMEESENGYSGNLRDIKGMVLNQCIFGIDINPRAVKLAKMSLWLESAQINHKLEKLDTQLVCADSLDRSRIEKRYFKSIEMRHFDSVIGNPPYVQVQMNGLNGQVKYEAQYKFQDFQYDLYLLFLERYEDFLKPGGQLGVIVSNTWLQSIKLRNIRKYLRQHYQWNRVLHVEDHIFDATVDTHALIFTLGQSASNGNKVFVDVLRDGEISLMNELVDSDLPLNGDIVNLVVSGKEAQLYEKIQKCGRLDEICDVFNGVKPFEKGKGSPPQSEETMKNKPFVVQGKKPSGQEWRPLLRGSLMNKFAILWKNDYWIKYGPWLAAPRKEAIFESSPKILVRQTGDSIIAAVDDKKFIARDNLHVVIHKEGHDVDPYYLVGILNSTLMDFSYFNINPEKGEALAQVKKNHVECLPIPNPDKFKKTELELAGRIAEIAKKMCSSNAATPQLIGQLDKLVYELYGLDKSEITVIEKALQKANGKKRKKNEPAADAA